MLCVAAAGGVLALAVTGFTLDWTHSVERVTWEEDWAVTATGLRPVQGRVQGSGAGMEVPEGAVLRDGVWHYPVDLPWQRQVVLAASGATGAGWRLCAAGMCHGLGAAAGAPVRLSVADRCKP